MTERMPKVTNAPPPMFDLGLVRYPGASLATVLGLTDLWEVANRQADELSAPAGRFRISHWSIDEDGFVQKEFESLAGVPETLSAIIVPPTLAPIPSDEGLGGIPDWICRRYEQGTLITSVCGGAYALAASGLLAGRVITTHWAHRDLFAKRFPDVQLDTSRLIVDDGDIITAGGMMAWIDLGLRLVDRFLGTEVMLATARFMLIDPATRPQSYYAVFSPRLDHGDLTILEVQRWLQGSDIKGVTLVDMANRARLTTRTFLRRFQKSTGLNPTEYCQRLKLSRSRGLLERVDLSIQQISWQSGYEDVTAYRKVFRKLFGLTPGEYRSRFCLGLVPEENGA